MTEQASAPARALGGLTRRSGPEAGLRPTVLFAIVGSPDRSPGSPSRVWASDSLARTSSRLLSAPSMGWVIPILLAYVPGLVIGFMLFTLLVNPYRELELVAPAGPWPAGRWPAVTVLIAARNEADAIVPTLERIAGLTYPGPVEVVLADNGSTDRTGELGDEAAQAPRARLPASRRAGARQAPGAQHGARDGDDADQWSRSMRTRCCSASR